MIIKEYRFPMPFTLEEYKVAQLYMIARASKELTHSGDGVEFVKNEPYSDETGTGQYTFKIIHIDTRLPRWLRAVLPKSALMVEEEAWNAYPYTRTIMRVPFLGDRFSIEMVTRYEANNGQSENVLCLSDAELAQRTVEVVDLIHDESGGGKYLETYQSTRATPQRGPFPPGWMESQQPVVTSYKVCKVECRIFGLQGRLESYIANKVIKGVILNTHRRAIEWIDDWAGMTLEDVRAMEVQIAAELKERLEGAADAEKPKKDDLQFD